MIYYASTHQQGMDMKENSTEENSIKIKNAVIVALFDRQLDYIPKSPTTKERTSWHPATELLSTEGLPIVSKYILITPKEHLVNPKDPQKHQEHVNRLVSLLEDKMRDIIHTRIKDVDKAKVLISRIKVEPKKVDYDNIWDIKSCTENLNPLLNDILNEFPSYKDAKPRKPQAVPKPTLIISLLGSTTAARTALYLTTRRLERESGRFQLRLVKYLDDTKPANLTQLWYGADISSTSNGLLRQGVGTQHPTYATELDKLERVIHTFRDAKILITGPTGAGKSELARLIIDYMQALHSNITEENCIVQNVAAVAKDLIDSEFLGHEENAFTDAKKLHRGIFERANNGILLLDEIGELPLHQQAKLLTILDGTPFTRVGGETNVTSRFLLLCGTNKDLRKECDAGRFRKDLYERLNTWCIDVPAIKDRPADRERALQRELEVWKTAHKIEVMPSQSTRKAFLDKAKQYDWEGNFREFHATFLHLALFAGKGGITEQAIEDEFRRKTSHYQSERPSSVPTPSDKSNSSESVYDLAEIARLACALDVCRKCKTATEAGELLFAARAESARRKQTGFNGAASLQRIFAQFGLKAHFKNGTISVAPVAHNTTNKLSSPRFAASS